jgi:hypothetical protein
MKQSFSIFVAAALILIIVCDPGMTIRQVEPTKEGISTSPQVTIQVETSHVLVGETWYAPVVRATNSSGTAIAVAIVEFTVGKRTYENRPHRVASYPTLIRPGETQILDVSFDLNSSVRTTFRTSAELRVHYRSGDKDEIAVIPIVGGPLDTSAP